MQFKQGYKIKIRASYWTIGCMSNRRTCQMWIPNFTFWLQWGWVRPWYLCVCVQQHVHNYLLTEYEKYLYTVHIITQTRTTLKSLGPRGEEGVHLNQLVVMSFYISAFACCLLWNRSHTGTVLQEKKKISRIAAAGGAQTVAGGRRRKKETLLTRWQLRCCIKSKLRVGHGGTLLTRKLLGHSIKPMKCYHVLWVLGP